MVTVNDYKREILEKAKKIYEKNKLDEALRIGNKRLKKINKKLVYDKFLNKIEVKEL